jgi:hypothetical protein
VTTIVDDLIVDTDTLFVDVSTDRVGINTATPTVSLDIVGDAKVSGTLTAGNFTPVNVTMSGNLSVDGDTTLGNASGDSLTINGNAVSIPNGLNIDSNTLVIDSTNNRVGIGTNSPAKQLEVFSSGGNTSVQVKSSAVTTDFGIVGTNDAAFLYTRTNHNLKFGTNDAPRLEIANNGQLSAVVPGGSTLYPGYLCRAWVNFNGTGTVAIRASGNVSSITDNGTGEYTINFINAMPNADYAFCGATTYRGVVVTSNLNTVTGGVAPAVGSCRINTSTAVSDFDSPLIMVAFFR